MGNRIRIALLSVVLLLSASILVFELNQEEDVSNDIEFFQKVAMVEEILDGFMEDSVLAHQIAFYSVYYSKDKSFSPILVAAIILEESNAKPTAKGLAGEIGLMQIHPRFWRGVFPECGRNLFNIKTNICYGTNVLQLAMKKYNKTDHGIALYNGSLSSKRYVKNVNNRLGSLYLILLEETWTLCPNLNPRIEL